MHGIVDEKTDVFAFGVLLLEIISGRRPIDSSKQSLLLWVSNISSSTAHYIDFLLSFDNFGQARPLIESGNLLGLVDPKLRCKYDAAQLQRLVLIASCCVRQSSIWRPSMIEVSPHTDSCV